MKSPIFLFSLPRSGSTLLQRVLMGHKDIASVAEPWLMLPFCYAYKKQGVLTEYEHSISYTAFEDFVGSLPEEDDYYQALGKFANSLYEKQCTNNEKYFLDKTPRYYHIIPEIAKAFPQAKFIFLFRNPVHVMSSMIQTWGDGRLKRMYSRERDLNFGPKALSEGYKLLNGKAYAIQYEEFVQNQKECTKEICKYLEIDFDEKMLIDFASQDTKGRMGDLTGVKEYETVDIRSLEKWKRTFNTSFRKKYIERYVKNIHEEVFITQGYDKNSILDDIKSLEPESTFSLQDRLDLVYSRLVQVTKPNIWLGNSAKVWARNRFLS